jgi:hypothetical protein
MEIHLKIRPGLVLGFFKSSNHIVDLEGCNLLRGQNKELHFN